MADYLANLRYSYNLGVLKKEPTKVSKSLHDYDAVSHCMITMYSHNSSLVSLDVQLPFRQIKNMVYSIKQEYQSTPHQLANQTPAPWVDSSIEKF